LGDTAVDRLKKIEQPVAEGKSESQAKDPPPMVRQSLHRESPPSSQRRRSLEVKEDRKPLVASPAKPVKKQNPVMKWLTTPSGYVVPEKKKVHRI